MKKIIVVGVVIVLVAGYWHVFSAPQYKQIIGIPTPIKAWQWKKSLVGTEPLKISIITDTQVRSRSHVRGDYDTRYLTEKYTKPLQDFREGVAAHDPAFIVHLGDIIEGTDDAAPKGQTNLRLVHNELITTKKPIHWVIGNHETRSVSKEQYLEALEIDYLDSVFDQGPYRFIIIDSVYRNNGETADPMHGDDVRGLVPQTTVAWLREQLTTDQHVVVFLHQAPLFEKVTGKQGVINAQEIQKVLAKYNVSAVFNGHIERRYYEEKDGVEYYALPGTKKSPLYPASYYDVVLDKNGVDVVMHHRDPKTNEKVTEAFYQEDKMLLQK